MGDIDQDAKPVHLRERRAAKLGQAAMQARLITEVAPRICAICEQIMAVMSDRDVGDAEFGEAGEQAEILADGGPVLDGRNDGQRAGMVGGLYGIGIGA